MKRVIIFCLIITVSYSAHAQSRNLQLHLGADLIPGNAKNAYNGGGGVAVAYGFGAKKNGSAQVQAMYNFWKNKIASAGNLNLLMLQFGYKQGLGGSPVHVNVRTGAGYTFFGNGSGNHGHFNFATGLGYLVKTKSSDALDLNIDYNLLIGGQTTRTFLMVSLGYILALK